MEPLRSRCSLACRQLIRSAGRKAVRGFTLIELLVVFAIITTITGIVLVQHSSFNRSFTLANTAYDIALTLRSAETYGLGNRAAGSVANTGYGVHFDKAAPAAFTFFADNSPSVAGSPCHPLPTLGAAAPNAQPGDCIYTAGSDQKVAAYSIGNGITVSNFCAKDNTGWKCSTVAPQSLSTLDITFSRPNAEPFVFANGNKNKKYSAACLAVTSAQGDNRYVTVSASGEISATATSCP